MKITFVIPTANMAGGTRIIVSLADHLSRRGHDVLVVSAPPRVLALKYRIKNFITGKGSLMPPARLPSYLDGMDLKHHVIDRYRPLEDRDVPDADVIIATWWETAEWVCNLSASKGARAYFIQQYEVNFCQPRDRVDATWRLPMQKIVCSKWLAQKAAEEFGDDHAIVVNNGIDLKLFQAPQRQRQTVPTIGFLYSGTEIKRASHCLEVIRRLQQVYPDLRVLCFGATEPLEKHAMPDCCEYQMLPKQEQIREIYAQCDLWLCASQSEGFHLPPHEAMACRCPVVSTRVGGPMDMIEDGVNGYLVEIDDVDALTDRSLAVLAQTPQQWKQMSDAAYAKAIRYPWELATERFEKALRIGIERTQNGELQKTTQTRQMASIA